MGQYVPKITEVFNGTITADPTDSATFGNAGDLVLGYFLNFTKVTHDINNIFFMVTGPDAAAADFYDPDTNRVESPPFTSSIQRFVWAGTLDNPFGPRGIILPDTSFLRVDLTGASGTLVLQVALVEEFSC